MRHVAKSLVRISIHAPRTGSDGIHDGQRSNLFFISIHAPRTGSDVINGRAKERQEEISIHAPRTGSDVRKLSAALSQTNFNPRSPHGERPNNVRLPRLLDKFQSTLPARGATFGHNNDLVVHRTFQSTLPARGATSTGLIAPEKLEISIHAPRTGSDQTETLQQSSF